jgi:hypothetical protein
MDYPRSHVIVQNGTVVCTGLDTHGCYDEPGYQASLRRIQTGYEAVPSALPTVEEDM